jgi:hypothetical protein
MAEMRWRRLSLIASGPIAGRAAPNHDESFESIISTANQSSPRSYRSVKEKGVAKVISEGVDQHVSRFPFIVLLGLHCLCQVVMTI